MKFRNGAVVVLATIAMGAPLHLTDDANLRGADPPANAEDRPVAVVLGNPIRKADLKLDDNDPPRLQHYRAIADKVVAPLLSRFKKEQAVAATPAEIADFRVWMSAAQKRKGEPPVEELSQEDKKAIDEVAVGSIEKWKTDKALFEKYGGQVEYQQAGIEPWEAYRDWLRQEEKAGNFKIIDPEWSQAFWAYWEPAYHRHAVRKEDAFKVPFWKDL